MHPGGAPLLLTPQLIEDVKRILPTVLYMETVGDYLGVERTTWRKWVKRGAVERRRLAKEGAKPKASEVLYLEFFHTIKKSLAEGEIFDAGTIKKAAAEQWQASAWRLERRFPNRWGKKERLEMSTKKGQPMESKLTISVVPPEELSDAELAAEKAELAREIRAIGHRPKEEGEGKE